LLFNVSLARTFTQKNMKIVYLRKAGADVICFCTCVDGRVTFPAQMDCPWCGCGWLFTCITCRKAFAFAEGIELETTWEELAQEDLVNNWHHEPSATDIQAWIAAMKEILHAVRVGERYVILDGSVFPANSKDIEFDGWHSHHQLSTFPHFDALDDRSLLDKILGKRAYWETRALPKED